MFRPYGAKVGLLLLIITLVAFAGCARVAPTCQELTNSILVALSRQSAEGLAAVTDAGTIFEYGWSGGEGGGGHNPKPTSCREIANLRWKFDPEKAQVTFKEAEREVIAEARWLGRNEPGLNAYTSIVFQRKADRQWRVSRVRVEEICTRTR